MDAKWRAVIVAAAELKALPVLKTAAAATAKSRLSRANARTEWHVRKAPSKVLATEGHTIGLAGIGRRAPGGRLGVAVGGNISVHGSGRDQSAGDGADNDRASGHELRPRHVGSVAGKRLSYRTNLQVGRINCRRRSVFVRR
jgi:hypothetical protein